MKKIDFIASSILIKDPYNDTADQGDQGPPYIFNIAGPEYLTVSSSGPAGGFQYDLMGVYRLTGETFNKKPVWSRDEGNYTLFYNSGKLIL